ncbi:unnamed protein product [Rotaria sordida]|uniref:Uncharacterized protein n=2 Tax=Rotaria sordida TaxID=392033 RepID=A0A814UXA2_9BILA|nr:unnamed protein product [Rotaria sordida]
MTEAIINNSALNDVKKSLNEIKNLLKSTNLNDGHNDKMNLILDNIDSCFLQLSYDMKKMNNEIQLLYNKHKDQDYKLNRLPEEILNLKKQASKKRNNKSQTNTKQFAFYSYKRNLRKLKSDGASSENSLKILNKVINEFVNEADIWKGDFIDLLINKIDCNYHAHHIIDDYIEDLMNNQFTENIINYLENQHSIKLSVDGNDEVNLNKLIKLNIKIKTKLGCECAFSNHPQPHPP